MKEDIPKPCTTFDVHIPVDSLWAVELWELFTLGHLAWKKSWKVTAYTCVLETRIIYYISVLRGKKVYFMQFVLLYMRVYRHAYRTSFRVYFRLRGLLVGEARPDSCLQSLAINAACLASFKVTSSDMWTILKGRRTWWWFHVKFVMNCAPITQRKQ